MGSDESVELSDENRAYVSDVYARLGTITHYDLLGVARDADKKTIKRAYFRLAAIVHPDRHFGKKLGSFKAKMETLFARISDAYETLIAPERRAAYDRTLPAASAAPAKPAPQPFDREAAAKKQAALDALKAKYLEGKARAKQIADVAARARAAGDFAAAAGAYKQALALSPGDVSLAAAHAEVARELARRNVETHRRQAMLEERYGHFREAAASWKQVLDARPDDVEARDRLAAALAKIG